MSSEELHRRVRGMRAFWERLHGTNLFRAIASDLEVATAADGALFVLPGARRLTVAAATDPHAGLLDAIATQRQSPCSRALLTGRVVSIDDVLDGADEHDPWCALAVASNITSVLAVPLRLYRGPVAAVLLFGHAPGQFTAERRRLAVAIAGEAAEVVAHALARAGLPGQADQWTALPLGEQSLTIALREAPPVDRLGPAKDHARPDLRGDTPTGPPAPKPSEATGGPPVERSLHILRGMVRAEARPWLRSVRRDGRDA